MRYAGLATLSAAVLLLELTLTRVYSVSQGYHFAFLAVSLGLLGFGASGTVMFAFPRLWQGPRHKLLGHAALLFTFTALGSFWLITIIPFDAYRLVLERTMFLHMGLFYLAQTVPFFFAGLALGGALTLDPGKSGGLYGAGLVGSGIGAVLALAGPASWGPSAALGGVMVLGTLAWLAFALEGRSARGRLPVAAAGLVLLVVGWLSPMAVETRMSPYKTLPQVLRQQGSELVWTGWNAFSRVDVVASSGLHQAPGLSFGYTQTLPAQTALTIDGDRLTSLTASAPEDAAFTEYLPTAAPYQLTERPSVLVVEPGGGLDVLTALHHRAARVVGLIANPLEAAVLKGRFRDAAGGVFTDPRVEVVTGNPRGYLARSRETFDVVVVSLRDAFRPITNGAYSLQESHLYTVEAFQQYLGHLSPGGIMMVTRWVQTPPSEGLRVAATVVQALEDQGIEEPRDKVAAIRTMQTLTVLAKLESFSPTQIQAVADFAGSRQMDISYLPGMGIEDANRFFVLPVEEYYLGFQELMDPVTRRRLYGQQQFDVTPSTDQRPFFFHFFRWGQVPDVLSNLGQQWQPFGGAGFLVVIGFLAVSLLVSAVLILLPLLARRGDRTKQAQSSGGVSRWKALTYFFALGLSFLLIELPLMQQFILVLAHPVYSFGVVLFAVLVFSGVGSIFSPRLGRRRHWAILALAALALVYAAGTRPLVGMMLGLPLAGRMVMTVVAIAPLAFLMGVPFPTGIVALERRRPELIPWAWGANGYASVIGSGLAVLMALSWGFSWVMAAAGAGYLIAWVTFRMSFSESATSRTERS